MGKYYIREIDEWTYVQLTKQASKNGGPKHFIDKIHNRGFVKGTALALLISGGIFAGIHFVNKKRDKRIKENKDMILVVQYAL